MKYVISLLFLLAGCASHASRSPTGPAASPSGTEPVRVDGFEVALTQLSVSGSMYQALVKGYRREGSPWSLQGTMAVRDRKHRMFRLVDRSAVNSAVDARGREMATEPALLQNYDRKDGFRLATRQNSGESIGSDINMNFTVTSSRPMTSLERLAGNVILEYVVADEDWAIPVPEVEKAVELRGGAKLTLKAMELDEKGPARRFALEITVVASETQPIVQAVELLDGQGIVLLTGIMQEQVLVGTTLRTRYTSDGNGNYGRQSGAPKTIRVRMLTKFEQVTIPFAWGPIASEGG